MTSLYGCRFEVETDGESMDVLDVSLDKMKDEAAEEQDEPEDDQDSAYGGPVRPHRSVCQSIARHAHDMYCSSESSSHCTMWFKPSPGV